MSQQRSPGPEDAVGFWLDNDAHRAWLKHQSETQLDFFTGSIQAAPGFSLLGFDGAALETKTQELFTTTRLIHSYSLGVCRATLARTKLSIMVCAIFSGTTKTPFMVDICGASRATR
jgi:hypothetical protein